MNALKRIPQPLQSLVPLIVSISQRYNAEAFLVGGPLRDLLMTKTKLLTRAIDFDIAVTNSYQKIGRDLAAKLKAQITHYPQFMTMTLQCPQLRIDIAQTRKEYYAQPAVLPQVSSASIEEDLKRRDFTINAMALKLMPQPPYPIIDLFNGQKDIKQKQIRVLHPNSFIDDPTRIFRAIRFGVRFNFKLEPITKLLMKKSIEDNLINLLSGERILYELKMILGEKKATEMLKILQQYKMIERVWGIKLPKRFFQESRLLDDFSDIDAKLGHLFAYFPESTWSQFPLTNEVKDCAQTIKKFPSLRKSLIRAKLPSRIYKILSPLPKSALNILSLIEEDAINAKIKLFRKKYSVLKIHTTGATLKSMKIPPGPIYTKILNSLKYSVLDGKIKTKNEEIKYIKSLIKRLGNGKTN